MMAHETLTTRSDFPVNIQKEFTEFSELIDRFEAEKLKRIAQVCKGIASLKETMQVQ